MDGITSNIKIKSLKDAFILIKANQFFKMFLGKDATKIMFYHKINGYDSNQKESKFTSEETEEIKQGLINFSNELKDFAENM